ncbi:MAG TPA: hypothetical protein VL401_03890 [Alphaproteobacteria bacterium]|jgi:hypothetical protein|nr:hypothetical protein [Alphaproteobacteria bacterium]
MKSFLKFVVWVIVLFLLSFLHVYLIAGRDDSFETLILAFLVMPIGSTIVFQLLTYFNKKLSFSNHFARIIVVILPSFAYSLILHSAVFHTFLAIYYLVISFVGDKIRMWIEARGKKNN